MRHQFWPAGYSCVIHIPDCVLRVACVKHVMHYKRENQCIVALCPLDDIYNHIMLPLFGMMRRIKAADYSHKHMPQRARV
jgi:hypothetical protein